MKKLLVLFFILFAGAALTGCPEVVQSEHASSRESAVSAGTPAPVAPAQNIYAAPMPLVQYQQAAPSWQPVAGRVVILDAGHGGDNLGANYFGIAEKDVTLDMAKRTAQRLQAMGVNVRMTRQTDVFVPLADRSAFANKHPNAVFISIHCNASAQNPQATGIETYILSKQFSDDEQCRRALARYSVTGQDKTQSRQQLETLTRVCRAEGPILAANMQKSLITKLGDRDRGIKPGNLAVLRETFFCPAVLVEVGFLSNYQTARKMTTSSWRDTTSLALAEGIVGYLQGNKN